MAERAQITIKGIVQGVGFRPFVFGLATSMGLAGHVVNTSGGVLIEIEGDGVPAFLERVIKEAPPLSLIEEYSLYPLPVKNQTGFRILESMDGEKFTLVSPDVSTCDDCLRELFDPGDRRYLYPFINCTNCGPRYSITRAIPYDRANTTMASFQMCPECMREYTDPADRRFHAEPNACPACGPNVELVYSPGFEHFDLEGSYGPILKAVHLLREGFILAIKGLGGFHLACDAMNELAVSLLRKRKRKSNKPFALMAPDIETIERYCYLSPEERALITSRRRPIVLLKKRGKSPLDSAAPNNDYLGFMLPYTPLHYVILKEISRPLVMTSGNHSEEPIIKDNSEALKRLSTLADAFLLHNRDIFMRVDDSVIGVREIEGKPARYFVRRSRGYVPEPVVLRSIGPEVMGTGADLKNTFTLTKGSFAIPGQHIGDMENYLTLLAFEESLKNIRGLYRAECEAVAHDLHPDYLSTSWAGGKSDTCRYAVQHHYAHIGSVMAEHGLKGPVIGVAMDGTGYGTDGKLWGGEFLLADVRGFKRLGNLKYAPLPGGEKAVKEPWRTAIGYLINSNPEKARYYVKRLGFFDKYGKEKVENIIKISGSDTLSAMSSGMGRLFDAISCIAGICDINTFEAEAAIGLEAAIKETEEEYPYKIEKENILILDFSQAISEIAEDAIKGTDKGLIAGKFHNTVCAAITETAVLIREKTGVADIALSGGSFQNNYVVKRTVGLLKRENFSVYLNEKVPANDGGISLGQAYLIRERLNEESTG
jgi:hydrogenase maturation protein HypF